MPVECDLLFTWVRNNVLRQHEASRPCAHACGAIFNCGARLEESQCLNGLRVHRVLPVTMTTLVDCRRQEMSYK